MKKKNFLKLKDERKRAIFKYGVKRKWTWKHFEKWYKQPPWCMYPEALRGLMGCWSLVGKGGETFGLYKNKCYRCDESIHCKKKPKEEE